MVSVAVGAEMETEGGGPGQVFRPLWEDPETSAGGGSRTGSEVGNEIRWRWSLGVGTRNRDGLGLQLRLTPGSGLELDPRLAWGWG